jgi:S-adenosyl-L-methionine hydrolase (adenosine-forming)
MTDQFGGGDVDGGELRYDTVTFLSDYGTADEFVGIVKSVIRQLAPGVDVVDLTHEVPPFDVRGGGLTLARSVQYVCPGVILAVVDPGVGTARRGVAVEVLGGRATFVGPDNGLLAAAVAMVGGAERAVVLDDPEYHLGGAGPTFDGRDVFAPVAAHLCRGVPLESLGTTVSVASLMPGMMPLTRAEGDEIVGEVLWVDRFGNVQLNVDPDELEGWGDRIGVSIAGSARTARRARTFGEVGTAELGIIVDSYGLMALVTDRASAAELLRVGESDEVRLRRLGDDEEDAVDEPVGVSTTVTLGRSRSAT